MIGLTCICVHMPNTNMYHAKLPATGVPVTRQRNDHMQERFDEYVRKRTMENWKFWIFSTVMSSLFETYNTMVSTASVEDLCRTVLTWLEQHCSLTELRPSALHSLTSFGTRTSILHDPTKLPEQARAAVLKSDKS